MQGQFHNIVNMHDSLKTFIHKLTNMKASVEINKYEAFPKILNSFPNITIKQHIIKHLDDLINNFKKYSPHICTFDTSLLTTPFSSDCEEVPELLRNDFIMLYNNNTEIRIFHEQNSLESFWCYAFSKYKLIGEWALGFLVQLSSTYLCESAFSHLVLSKSNHRNKLAVNYQLVITVSKIESRIEIMAKNLVKSRKRDKSTRRI